MKIQFWLLCVNISYQFLEILDIIHLNRHALVIRNEKNILENIQEIYCDECRN